MNELGEICESLSGMSIRENAHPTEAASEHEGELLEPDSGQPFPY